MSAQSLMSSEYLAFEPQVTVGDAIRRARMSGLDPDAVSYLYVISEERSLMGVVDIRELVLTQETVPLVDIMSTSVVAAEGDKAREDLEELFGKYRYRMLPVVDQEDHLLGVIRHNDLMQAADQST